jgi:putative peptidoglycan lipid II flippase
MMQRILSFFSRKIDGLHAAAYLIGFFAFLSQLLGLVRDRILAGMFGASGPLDVYYAAFRIPDVVFASVASFVLLFVLIPFLTRKLEENQAAARKFISEVTTVFTAAMIGVSVILFFLVPALSHLFYPGFSGTQHDTLVTLTRILLLSPILLGLSNIVASVTQITRRFVIYSLSPILYNAGIIVGVVVFYPLFGMEGLAYGVCLGALLHLGIQLPSLARERLVPYLTNRIIWSDIRSLVLVSIPRTMALALDQLVLLALVGIASRFPGGSITVFTFALNINLAPLTIIGVSYSVAAFPTLAALFSNGEKETFVSHLLTAVRHILFWSLPATALFIVLRAHIVRVVLGSGAFDWSATRLTAAVMGILVLSIAAHGLMLLFVRAYYAAGRTARPLLVNIGTSVFTLAAALASVWVFERVPAFRFFLESLFRVADVPGTIVLTIALGYTVGMFADALCFWLLFRKDFGGHVPGAVYKTLWESFAASIIAGGAAYMALRILEPFVDLNSFLGVLLHGVASGFVGSVAAIVVLLLLRNQELSEMWQALHTRFWKSRPLGAPEAEQL